MSTPATKRVYGSKRFKTMRDMILAETPDCAYCGAQAVTVDHIVPLAAGGAPYDWDNLNPTCRRCNSARAGAYTAAVKKGTAAAAAAADVLGRDGGRPRPIGVSLSPTTPADQEQPLPFTPEQVRSGTIPPRLETRSWGLESYGQLVIDWARRNLKDDDGRPLELFPWQQRVLVGFLEHKGGRFRHEVGLVSTSRQQGKTRGLLAPLIGWMLTDACQVFGRPMRVVTAANKLDIAQAVSRELLPVLDDRFGFKTWESWGRHGAEHPAGAQWNIIEARSPSAGHGLTADLVCVDEIHDIKGETITGGLMPTMRSRPNPLLLMTSTAGTDSSTFFREWRDQCIAIVDKGERSPRYFAEWSVPPDVPHHDERWWPAANPALNQGYLTLERLRSELELRGLADFKRGTLNQWVASVNSWLPAGAWDALTERDLDLAGGVVCVDSSNETQDKAAEYVGVRACRLDDGRIAVRHEFTVHHLGDLAAQLETIREDKQTMIKLTPALWAIAPQPLRRTENRWGHQEIKLATGPVRQLIYDGTLVHAGQQLLSEHVRRAVAGANPHGVELTSKGSPGPIYLARCMVAAAGAVLEQRPPIRAAVASSR